MNDKTNATDINDIAPTSLAHLIGQASVKAQVTVALEAAFADHRRFDSSLLVGPPGLGKSIMASVIAAEMASNFHDVLGQNLQRPADLYEHLLAAQDKDVLHIDEAHEMPKPCQTALYLALDKRQIQLPGAKGIGSLRLEDFTMLLSTTDEYRLLQPLRDRMRLVLRFEFYSVDELIELTRHRAAGLRWDVEAEVFPLIAQRSRGTPRFALRLLQSCHRVCRAGDQTVIRLDHLERACMLEQLDALGLGPIEQKYLRHLAAGASRLNVLASILGLPARTVSMVTEPFLLRCGLMVKDDQSRRLLTAAGREHLLASS